MTDAEYSDFLRESGRMAASQVERMASRGSLNVQHPTERDLRALRLILANSRRITRSRLAQQLRGGRSAPAGAEAP